MNMKALLLLLHRDLRDNCLIISGQMRHFAADFIVFFVFFSTIHYSSLTSHSKIRATGREKEQTLQSYLAKERKGKEREDS